mgnify:CR=1 FL=1
MPTAQRRAVGERIHHRALEALLAHLLKERSPEAVRLRVWVEREIVFPARRERERLGIKAAGPDPRASE